MIDGAENGSRKRGRRASGSDGRTFRRWRHGPLRGGRAGGPEGQAGGGAVSSAGVAGGGGGAGGAPYRDGCAGWNVLHFYHEVYAGEHGGARSYTWVKSRLQEAGLVRKGRRKGAHRLRRERKPAEGMMLHQDASTHEWAPGQGWDLVVTMDDATSGVYSGFFVEEEGTWSSLRGVAETVKVQGLFDSLYTDRGSHYWHTPEAGGKVDKDKPTQFGQTGVDDPPRTDPASRAAKASVR